MKSMLPRMTPLVLCALVLGAMPRAASGQTFQVVHSFQGEGGGPFPNLLQVSDGTLYGVTQNGGASHVGSVFTLQPDGAGGFTFETFFSFGTVAGMHPLAALIQGTDGYFYGSTSGGTGGLHNQGSIFRLTPSVGQAHLTTLHGFTGADGDQPYGSLVEAADGMFYGTTLRGGTECGGAGCGTVFRMTPDGALTVLRRFSGPDGIAPTGLIQAADGDFYGVTREGGDNGLGTIYTIDSEGRFLSLHSFSGADGQMPLAQLVQANDGNFYGSTQGGGTGCGDPGCGTIFQLTGDLTTFTRIHSFDGSDGADVQGALIQAGDGRLYGTTNQGGTSNKGTVFRVDLTGLNFETLYGFAGQDGAWSAGGLIQAADGNFYGPTLQGGWANRGTVYRLDGLGSLTTIHAFSGVMEDGRGPSGALVQGTDGLFYGTTEVGGMNNNGTVFTLDAFSTVTLLHSFAQDEGQSPNGLMLASDGNFYGTAIAGGPPGATGTVFKIAPDGQFTVVHAFSGSEGIWPYSRLIQDNQGFFYGTTSSGGTSGLGTVFRMDAAGVVTTLHSFSYDDGRNLYGGVTQASDGFLYGMTFSGGANDLGTIFRVAPDGSSFEVLYSFDGPHGALPYRTTLIQALDGNLYGTATGGGTGNGVVFKIDLAGNYTLLHAFDGNEGATPYAGLLQTGVRHLLRHDHLWWQY